jgi:hypothetical protein
VSLGSLSSFTENHRLTDLLDVYIQRQIRDHRPSFLDIGQLLTDDPASNAMQPL